MTAAFPPSSSQNDWKALYRAAMLETNRSAIPQKVLAAEQAILARGLQLFQSNGTVEEKECQEDALYALRAFKTAWQHSEAA